MCSGCACVWQRVEQGCVYQVCGSVLICVHVPVVLYSVRRAFVVRQIGRTWLEWSNVQTFLLLFSFMRKDQKLIYSQAGVWLHPADQLFAASSQLISECLVEIFLCLFADRSLNRIHRSFSHSWSWIWSAVVSLHMPDWLKSKGLRMCFLVCLRFFLNCWIICCIVWSF